MSDNDHNGLLNDALNLLRVATELEESRVADQRIEAATKYYEAVYLLRQVLQRLPQTPEKEATRQFIMAKVTHFDAKAKALMAATMAPASSSSTSTSRGSSVASLPDPRSPMYDPNAAFFVDPDGTVVAVAVPIPNSSSAATVATTATATTTPSLPPALSTATAAASPLVARSHDLTQQAAQANARLARALDLDERQEVKAAIEEYMSAAELYLKCIRLVDDEEERQQQQRSTIQECSDSSIKPLLKRRLKAALNRVEQLKHPVVTRRGVIVKELQVSEHKTPPRPSPTSSPLTADEISVLKRSSLIASGLFLPWADEDATKLVIGGASKLFTDPDGLLALSPQQKTRFHKWARPSEIALLRQRMGLVKTSTPPVMIKSITPYSIRQQYVTDCSFIASLCICASFERRFQKRLVTSIVFPKSAQTGLPVYNPAGKYMVKLWLNGVARQVVVDDLLPIDKYGNLLCSHTNLGGNGGNSTLELWVSIIEKAYMKLCGGYDFPGSNSGVDLFSLTGWIPERIFFPADPLRVRDFETPAERAWERLYSASSFGDCLITVSTSSDISETKAEEIGLVTGHAYAVLSVIQTKNGTRLLQLKNPWAHKGWKGKYSPLDSVSWKDPGLCTEVGYNPQEASRQDDGVFWISWSDILVYFQNLHLSWNPALFAHRVTTHSFWPKDQGPQDDTFNVGENPQYIMTLSDSAIQKKASIWILVSRHVTKQEQEGAEVTDFLTIHLHRTGDDKERIWYPGGPNCVLTGAYTNNPHVLVRYDVDGPADARLALVLSQYKKSHDLAYTLSCFCTEPFSLGQPRKNLPFQVEFASAWTASSAGGPVGIASYNRNPMWAVQIPEGGAVVQIRCSAVKTFAVNVLLVPVNSFGQRIGIAMSQPAVDSGNYRHGFVVTKRKQLPAGFYTLAVSTFSVGQQGSFKLQIGSSVKLPKVSAI